MNNRIIKFRAWDSEKKIMVIITSLNFWHDSGIKLANNGDVHEGSVMQYTGLKDKNGVEIYEGDIVKTDFGGIYIVDYSFGAAAYICNNKNGQYVRWLSSYKPETIFEHGKTIEVIGNIYENPELLTPPTK